MELVSILVPCRNAAPWIGRALDSALQQTWKNIEVIVVDDGSVDGSYQIARKFSGPRCRVMKQEARGASAARNRAFALAQGGVIQYLDADDLLAPDKVERQLEVMRDCTPYCLTWSSAVYLLEGSEHGRSRFEEARAADPGPVKFLARLWGGHGEPGSVLVHQWMASRDLIRKAGAWNESLTIDDDGEFFTRVVLAAEWRLPAPEARCYYRKFHGGNLSNAIFREVRHRRSDLEAACLKCGYLLNLSNDVCSRRAVSRLMTQRIVDAYPLPAHRIGVAFLEKHGLPLSTDFAAAPWFLRAWPVLGWRAARRLQDFARSWRGGRQPHETVSGAASPGR